MKNLFLSLFTAMSLSLLFTSCGGGENTPETPDPQSITGEITVNTTWTNDRIWVLNQKVVVKSGVTLTIEAGTIIKGSEGQGSLASALVIARGGKIMAEGTASQPIIFTSINDNIAVGQTAGTNLSAADNGLWGGLLIMGKAKGSFVGDVSEYNIEGIPASDTFGLYGGTDDADNSGSLKYVSIRHGGAEIGEGNEINGLTLGCVGSGTVIQNIEVVANYDDGIEFFGGTVSVTNALVWSVGDDGLDIDQAYSGSITNAMVIQGTTSQSGLEIDGREGSLERGFTIDKLTLKGNSSASKIAEYKSKAYGITKNVYAYGWSATSTIKISDVVSSDNFVAGNLDFINWQLTLASGATLASTLSNSFNATFATDIAFSSVVTPSTGADATAFNWTYAKSKSAF
ncbi:MAG: hypothetical protein IT220_05365 [Flavobacteriaceae bacterium]|nr:hypothetical protein [Flavobacteriaceae bacterium]